MQMQGLWSEYVQTARGCCVPEFWQVYKTVRMQTTTCRDAVLSCVKNMVPQHCKTHAWPRSERTLRSKVSRVAGNFWDLVTHTHTIDLSEYELPGCNSVRFSFFDPVYIWIQLCNNLCAAGIPLHWDPKKLLDPRSEMQVHGSGVQYGLLFRHANANLPKTAKAALFNISWDAGNAGFGGRSVTPILVQVMNQNSTSTKVSWYM